MHTVLGEVSSAFVSYEVCDLGQVTSLLWPLIPYPVKQAWPWWDQVPGDLVSRNLSSSCSTKDACVETRGVGPPAFFWRPVSPESICQEPFSTPSRISLQRGVCLPFLVGR